MRSYTYRDAILPFDINQVIMSKRRKVVSTVNIGSWSENTSFTPGKTAVQWAGGVKPVQALRTECPAGKRNVDPYECADCTEKYSSIKELKIFEPEEDGLRDLFERQMKMVKNLIKRWA